MRSEKRWHHVKKQKQKCLMEAKKTFHGFLRRGLICSVEGILNVKTGFPVLSGTTGTGFITVPSFYTRLVKFKRKPRLELYMEMTRKHSVLNLAVSISTNERPCKF